MGWKPEQQQQQKKNIPIVNFFFDNLLLYFSNIFTLNLLTLAFKSLFRDE